MGLGRSVEGGGSRRGGVDSSLKCVQREGQEGGRGAGVFAKGVCGGGSRSCQGVASTQSGDFGLLRSEEGIVLS